MAPSRPLATFVVRALLLLAPVIFAAASAQAKEQHALPPARLIVTGQGSVTVAPDYAVITGGVTTRAKTAKAATNANTKLMAAVDAALHKAGIAQEDIQTVQFSVRPVYAPPQLHAAPQLTGFEVSNRLSITIHRIAEVGDVLDRMIAAGASNVGNVSLLHANLSKALDRARRAAVADARRKAELYAKAADLKLGGVAWITEEPGSTPPLVRSRTFALDASVPISAGQDTLRVQITVGFDVAH